MLRVCVGAVAGAHGVRGEVRIKSFTETATDVGAYGPVESEDGLRQFGLRVMGEVKGLVIARLEGINDRTTAEGLRGQRLYVPRDQLPQTEEDEFLLADLVGLRAETAEGEGLGTVVGIADFGAGEIMEIALHAGGAMLVPFTREAVPVVAVAEGRLVVCPPTFAPDEKEEQNGR